MWATGTGSTCRSARTYKALHEKAMGGLHAEQVNPELVNFLGQKLGAQGEVA